jgi:hypothetical protein
MLALEAWIFPRRGLYQKHLACLDCCSVKDIYKEATNFRKTGITQYKRQKELSTRLTTMTDAGWADLNLEFRAADQRIIIQCSIKRLVIWALSIYNVAIDCLVR